jgi:acyl-CoA reductase-like NAD-dependent aldehyde dehydrogenase
MEPMHLTIGGKAVKTSRNQEIYNPSTGELVGLMPLAGSADLDSAVRVAAFTVWKNSTDSERAVACRRGADVIEANAEELAKLLTLEQGKPMGGFGSRFEIGDRRKRMCIESLR